MQPTPSPFKRWSSTAGVVALCTAISAVLESRFDPANLVLVYLAGAVYVALQFGREAALGCMITSLLIFDFIFVPPRWGFKPTEPQYYFTFAVTLAVGLIISELAFRARRQTEVAIDRAEHAQALLDLTMRLVAARSTEAIACELRDAVYATFGADCTVNLVDGDEAAESGGREAVTAGPVVSIGSPASQPKAVQVPLVAADHLLGTLTIAPWPAENEGLKLLDAFVSQAALALDRASHEDKSAQARVDVETERIRNTLLASISHDLRTPLTTIVGSATSLLEQDAALEPSDRILLLENVRDEARRMHEFMSDVLEMTRLEGGNVEPRLEWCPADELIEEARNSIESRLGHRRLVVTIKDDPIVWCDPRLIVQVIVNLVTNSVAHTAGEGSISIHVAADTAEWHLIVSDDGPGLPAGQEAHLFKKFVGATQVGGSGTGLGLAICSAIVLLHHGTIAASGGPGASFTLAFPQPPVPSVLSEDNP